MSFLTSATEVAIEKDLKKFLIILLVALSAASLPKILALLRQVPSTLFVQSGLFKKTLLLIMPKVFDS